MRRSISKKQVSDTLVIVLKIRIYLFCMGCCDNKLDYNSKIVPSSLKIANRQIARNVIYKNNILPETSVGIFEYCLTLWNYV